MRSFGEQAALDPGTYRLQLDMAAYPDAAAKPFFHEVVITFRVTEASGHYHVMLVISPYGYLTYRGN